MIMPESVHNLVEPMFWFQAGSGYFGGNMEADNFTKNFKKYFIKSGLTQVELAKRLGTSQGAISKILSGKELPRLKLIIKILDVFTVDFETFCNE